MRKTDNPNLTTSYKIQQSILNDQEPSEAQVQTINSFFYARWLSGNKNTVFVSAIINRYYNIPIRAQYIFARDHIILSGLKNKIRFIGYPGDPKLDKDYQKCLSNIQRFYKVNPTISVEYFGLMDNTQRDRFYNMYDGGVE
jgi:hypothetical protein